MPRRAVEFSRNIFSAVDEKNARKTSILRGRIPSAVCNRAKHEVFHSIFPPKINRVTWQSLLRNYTFSLHIIYLSIPFVKINGRGFAFFTDFPEKYEIFPVSQLFSLLPPFVRFAPVFPVTVIQRIHGMPLRLFFLRTRAKIHPMKKRAAQDFFSRSSSKDLTNTYNCGILIRESNRNKSRTRERKKANRVREGDDYET